MLWLIYNRVLEKFIIFMKFIKKIIALWWLFLIGAIIGGIWFWNTTKAEQAKIEKKSFQVVRQDLVDSLVISGYIDASEKADLKFQTSGKLAWVGVREGDLVKKYQVVSSLDKQDLQNRMSQLMNSYMKTRWSFEQTADDNRDWETAGMTDVERDAVKRVVDKSQFDLNNSVLAVEAQQISLKLANLWTPIEGIVTKVDSPLAGINVTPTNASIQVINPMSIYLSATADQTEVVKFFPGQNCEVTMDSFPDQKMNGVVERVGFTPKMGETGTVYEVVIKLNFDNTNYQMKMGMTGDAEFVFDKKEEVLAVPTSYIKGYGSNKQTVELVDKNNTAEVEITTGKVVDGMVEILTGLKENDVIYSN